MASNMVRIRKNIEYWESGFIVDVTARRKIVSFLPLRRTIAQRTSWTPGLVQARELADIFKEEIVSDLIPA